MYERAQSAMRRIESADQGPFAIAAFLGVASRCSSRRRTDVRQGINRTARRVGHGDHRT